MLTVFHRTEILRRVDLSGLLCHNFAVFAELGGWVNGNVRSEDNAFAATRRGKRRQFVLDASRA